MVKRSVKENNVPSQRIDDQRVIREVDDRMPVWMNRIVGTLYSPAPGSGSSLIMIIISKECAPDCACAVFPGYPGSGSFFYFVQDGFLPFSLAIADRMSIIICIRKPRSGEKQIGGLSMKKVLAILVAALMIFSMMSAAFLLAS